MRGGYKDLEKLKNPRVPNTGENNCNEGRTTTQNGLKNPDRVLA
jgi:hypothetical protein